MNDDFLRHNRAAAIDWARDLLSREDWVILDTETTGAGPLDEVCQIGVLNPAGLVVWESMVRPSIPIPLEATAIHGITNLSVRAAPPFSVAGRGFVHFLESYIRHGSIVIYNADYDTRLLWQSARAAQVAWPEFRADCAMIEYARFVGEWNDYRGDFKWQKLPPIPGQEAHSAIADCRATLALIHRMAEAT